jgi:hypothetical protein
LSAGWAVLVWGLGLAALAAFFAGAIPALRTFRLNPIRDPCLYKNPESGALVTCLNENVTTRPKDREFELFKPSLGG